MPEPQFTYSDEDGQIDVYIERQEGGRSIGTMITPDGRRIPFLFEPDTVLDRWEDGRWVVYYPSEPGGVYRAFAIAFGQWQVTQAT